MKETKKVTISAMMSALAVVFLSIGAFLETTDLTVAALASLTVTFLYLEVGAPYTWLSWLVASLLTFVLFPQSPVFAEYLLIFGLYPIVKGYIERLPRFLWLIAKLLFFHAGGALFLLLVRAIFGLEFLTAEAEGLPLFVVYLLAVAAAIAYDLFLTVLVRLYLARFRDKFKRYLK